jgi:hypothetical protein
MAPKAGNGLGDGLKQAGLALAGGLALAVEKGAHRGASATSRAGTMSLGSSLDNDVVLISDNLAASHARLSLVDGWRGRLRIEARGAPVKLSDGRIVAMGRYADVELPALFQAGGAEFRASSLHDLGQARKFAFPVLALALLALLLPSFAGVMGGLFRSAPQISAPQTPQPITLSAEDGERWLERMRSRLRDTGLAGQITVERGGAGAIVAGGTIDPASQDRWRDVLKWFDSQSGAPLLLNNVTRSDSPQVLPSFRAVWLDAKPQVVLLSGQTAGIGETISGGWKIEAIEQTGVLLSREGRTARVTF